MIRYLSMFDISVVLQGQPSRAPHAVSQAAHHPLSPAKTAPSTDHPGPAPPRLPTSPSNIKSPATSPPARKWNQATSRQPSTLNSEWLAGSSRGGQPRGAFGGKKDTMSAEGRQVTPTTKEELPQYDQVRFCPFCIALKNTLLV